MRHHEPEALEAMALEVGILAVELGEPDVERSQQPLARARGELAIGADAGVLLGGLEILHQLVDRGVRDLWRFDATDRGVADPPHRMAGSAGRPS